MKFTSAVLLALATVAVNAGGDYDDGTMCPEISRGLDDILEDFCENDGLINLYYGTPSPTAAPSPVMSMMGKKGGMSMMVPPPPPECNCQAQIIAIDISGEEDGQCVFNGDPDSSFTSSCGLPVVDACTIGNGPTTSIGTWTFTETFTDTTYCKSYGDARGEVEGGERALQEEAAAADGDYGCCEVTGSTSKTGSLAFDDPNIRLDYQLSFAYDPNNGYGGAGITNEVYSINGGLPPQGAWTGFMKYLGDFCDGSSKGYSCGGDEYSIYALYYCEGMYDTCAIWDESEVDRLLLPNCESPYGCDYSNKKKKRRMEGKRKLSRKVKVEEAEVTP